jgi:integrase
VSKHKSSPEEEGAFRKVATGLYRSSTSGKYFAHVRIHGKLFRQSLKTSDRKLADRKLAEFRRKQGRIDPGAGKLTLRELCKRYEETIGHLSKSSIKGKAGILDHVRDEWPQGADVKLSSIKTSDCEIWLVRQAARVGKSHYNAFLTLLRDLFTLAWRDRLIAEHPCKHLKYRKREKPIRLAPSFEDFKRIVEDIRAQQFNADAKDSANFVEFIGLSGLGRAEAGSLTWGDIDFEAGTIRTLRHKTDQEFTVPVFPQLRPFLDDLRGKMAHDPGGRVFAVKDSKKALAGACGRLNLPHYTHVALRRMFITRAIEKGIDVKVIAQWQGHRDGGKLILDTYSHVNREHSQRMATLMSE